MLYGLLMQFRNFLFDTGIFTSQRFDFPVIGVGNLTLGGTGKSPHVEYLTELLCPHFQIAMLSRGYGRRSTGYREVKPTMTYLEAGDEPLMIKLKYPQLFVAVDGDRVRGIRRLKAEHPELRCVLLDDAFQHRGVLPGLNIMLTDYSNLYYKDFVVPTGRLREFRSGAGRADIIVVTKCPTPFSPVDARAIKNRMGVKPYQHVFFSTMEYSALQSVYAQTSPPDPKLLNSDVSVLLFTGIARSQTLYYYVKNQVQRIQHLRYADHHIYSISDGARIKSTFESMPGQYKIILTTEKDAIRLRLPGLAEQLSSLPIYFIPIKVIMHNREGDNFDELIMDYVRRN
jgi:tetraacyldisaccharide 4'-kinase